MILEPAKTNLTKPVYFAFSVSNTFIHDRLYLVDFRRIFTIT